MFVIQGLLEPSPASTRTHSHNKHAEQNGATAQMDKVVYDSKGKLTRPDTHCTFYVVDKSELLTFLFTIVVPFRQVGTVHVCEGG